MGLARAASLVVALMLIAPVGAVSAPSTSASLRLSCAGAVNWSRASALVGQVATVRGRVAGTKFAATSNGSPTFLNLGVDYPNPRRFTVVIWIENRASFGRPDVRYRNRTICVRGRVTSYAGVSEIIARSPRQVTVVG